MKRLLIALYMAVSIFGGILVASPASFAAPCDPRPGDGAGFFGFPTWYEYLPGDDGGGRCTPQIEDTRATLPIGIAVIEILLRLGGIVAGIMIIYGAFQYMLSQGEPDKAKGAKTTITNALIGLVLTIISAPIVSYIGTRVAGF